MERPQAETWQEKEKRCWLELICNIIVFQRTIVFDLKQGKVDDFNRVFFMNVFLFLSASKLLTFFFLSPALPTVAFKSIFLSFKARVLLGNVLLIVCTLTLDGKLPEALLDSMKYSSGMPASTLSLIHVKHSAQMWENISLITTVSKVA